MSCPHHDDTGLPTDIINLSQLDHTKSECHVEEGTCQLCQELLVAEKDVENAIAQLKTALNRRQQLKTNINVTHCSHIIRDLPIEILTRIFYLCFSKEMRDYGEPVDEDAFVPLKIGAVCRTWRQIVWSSPQFWTVIFMKRLLSSASHVFNQYAVMEGWVERSGVLPLHVYIKEEVLEDSEVELNANVSMIPEECQCWERCLRLLEKFSDRWEVASLKLSLRSFEYIADNLNLKAPTRRFAFGSPQTKWYRMLDQVYNPLNLRASSTAPEEITLKFPVRLDHLSINWHNVSHVEVQEWPLEECVSLLRHAPRLESCSFIRAGRFRPVGMQILHGGPFLPVANNSLRYLYIECDDSPAVFFDKVTLPSLKELVFLYSRGGFFPDDTPRSTFLREFITRSGCPLTALSLPIPPFTPVDYLDSVLQLLPSLVLLTLHFSASFSMKDQRKALDHILSHLTATASIEDSDFLPHLEELELGHSGDRNISHWKAIADAFGDPSTDSELGTRREGRRPFRSVVVGVFKPLPVKGVPQDVVDRLRSLQEAGAVIDFRVGFEYGGYRGRVPAKWE